MISRVVWDIQFVTSCYKLFVVNLLTTCYVRTTSDFLLEQFVAILLASSTLLQDDNNSFQICQQLHGIKHCEHILLTSCEIFTRVKRMATCSFQLFGTVNRSFPVEAILKAVLYPPIVVILRCFCAF